MIVPNCESATITSAVPNRSWPRRRQFLRRAWGRARWKMVAIVTFTATSTILIAALAVAALNVVVRRESANLVEKQIQILVQSSRSVAPAILDHAGGCMPSPTASVALKPLLACTDEAFPQAQTLLTMEDATGVRSLLPGPDAARVKLPDWLPETGFAGLVVDRGQIEIRNVVARHQGGCKITTIFSLPLGFELAKRLSSAGTMEVTTVSRPFREV